MSSASPAQLMTQFPPCKAVRALIVMFGALALLCGGLQAQTATNDTTSGSTLTISGASGQTSGVIMLNSGSLLLTNDPVVVGSTLTLSDGTVVNFANTYSGANTYTGATSITDNLVLNTSTTGGTLILNGSGTVSNATTAISGLSFVGSTSGYTITLNNSATLMNAGYGSLSLNNATTNMTVSSIGTSMFSGLVISSGTQTVTGLTLNNGTISLGTTPSTSVVTLASGGTLDLMGLSGSGIAVQLSKSSTSSSTQLGNTGLSLSFTNSGTLQSSGTVQVAALGSVPTGNTPTSASFTAPAVALIGIGNLGGQTIAERGVVYSLTATSGSPTLGGTGVIKVVHTGNPDPTGGFTLTAAGLAANTSYSYRVYATDSTGATVFSRPLTFTTPTVLQNWRQTFFGSLASTGAGADSADPDGDGVPNLIEFATGKNPTTSTPASAAVSHNGSSLEYTYPRSLDALNSGVTFSVEWNDTLDASQWSSAGVSEVILADDGLFQQVKATLPPSSTGRRFVRLKVLPPAQSSNTIQTAPPATAP